MLLKTPWLNGALKVTASRRVKIGATQSMMPGYDHEYGRNTPWIWQEHEFYT